MSVLHPTGKQYLIYLSIGLQDAITRERYDHRQVSAAECWMEAEQMKRRRPVNPQVSQIFTRYVMYLPGAGYLSLVC